MNESTHQRVNYVAEFSDGTVKTGVTRDAGRRVSELSRQKRDDGAVLVRAVETPAIATGEAFCIETLTCRLLSYLSPGPSREWFSPRSRDERIYDFIRETVGMFWNMRNEDQIVTYREVRA